MRRTAEANGDLVAGRRDDRRYDGNASGVRDDEQVQRQPALHPQGYEDIVGREARVSRRVPGAG